MHTRERSRQECADGQTDSCELTVNWRLQTIRKTATRVMKKDSRRGATRSADPAEDLRCRESCSRLALQRQRSRNRTKRVGLRGTVRAHSRTTREKNARREAAATCAPNTLRFLPAS